jgi:SAM-dependent MidA family methyltransferase
VAVGRQDLTAHVDLSALDRAFAAAGLVVLGGTTQAEFLAGLGIGDGLVAMQTGPDARLPDYLAARAAVVSMLDPGATGRFAVRLYGRDLAADPPLRGLAFRLGSSGRPA